MNGKNWVTMWAMAHCGCGLYSCNLANRTTRVFVKSSLYGEKIRIGLSNIYGNNDVIIGGVSIAITEMKSSQKKHFQIRYQGSEKIVIPAGKQIQSDEIAVPVNIGDEIEIRIYFPENQKLISGNGLLLSEYSLIGDYTRTNNFLSNNTEEIWLNINPPYKVDGKPTFVLSSIDLYTCNCFGIAVLGDSNVFNQKWTLPLADTLTSLYGNISLLNLGISGNRLLRGTGNPNLRDLFGKAGIERIEWDIFSLSGVRFLVLSLGGNDILQPGTFTAPDISELCSANELIDGYKYVIAKAKQKGLKIIGTTLSPAAGIESFDETRISIWHDVNSWIRNSSEFDYIIDIAKLLGDEIYPEKLKNEFDSGDHVHFNDLAGKHIVENIDTSIFVL